MGLSRLRAWRVVRFALRQRQSMKCPQWLETEAKAYWRRNAPALITSGQLNEQTLDDFCLLCSVWSDMKACPRDESKDRIWYLGLLKQYQALRKLFRGQAKSKSIDDIISDGMNDG